MEPCDPFSGLEHVAERARARGFPHGPRDPLLHDLFAGLVEYDAYIAGIVREMLRTRSRPSFPLRSTAEIRTRFQRAGEQVEVPEKVWSHLDLLDELVEAAMNAEAFLA